MFDIIIVATIVILAAAYAIYRLLMRPSCSCSLQSATCASCQKTAKCTAMQNDLDYTQRQNNKKN